MGKKRRKKGYLVVTKETFGKMNKYEAYRKAFEKYFVEEDEDKRQIRFSHK
jgi:hypothetical protein